MHAARFGYTGWMQASKKRLSVKTAGCLNEAVDNYGNFFMVPPKNINGFLTLYNKYHGFKIGIDRNFLIALQDISKMI